VTVLYWLTSLAALIGVWLNIRKHVASFWIWAFTNAVWAGVDYVHGIHAQAALQTVYFALSIYGIWKWSRCAGSQS
jgi:nicotinamide mononucleotide transporter